MCKAFKCQLYVYLILAAYGFGIAIGMLWG